MIFALIRITAFFLGTTILFPSGTPKIFKLMFSLFLSVIVSMTVNLNIVVNDLYTLITYSILETITGLVLGYMTSISFNVIKLGGKLIDQQMGLSMANIYDPQTGTQSTLIENIVYWFGVVVFFQINGHHALISGINQSFEIISIGQSIIENNMSYIVYIFVKYFIIGIKIAVPILLALFVSELIMGIISRSVPQLNVMIIGMPVKLLGGILLIIACIPYILYELQSIFNTIPSILDGTLTLQPDIIFPVGVLLSTGDKTEEPTAKKKKDERKKGNIAKSKELQNAITLCGIVLAFYTMSGYTINQIKLLISRYLRMDMILDFSYDLVQSLLLDVVITFAKLFLPIGLIILILGIIANLVQSGLLRSGEGLKPKLSKLNPISGLKNMFSMKALGNLVKSIAIIVVLGYVGVLFIQKNFEPILKSGNIYFPYLIYWVIDILKDLLGNILIAVIIIGILDYAYQLYIHKKQMKMTKQEVKEEYKQMEGDPHIKGKRKQKQRELASKRMMQAVPTSTVVITNPTHLAIAIRYEKGIDSAPIVVAKGADHVALKIREMAKENDIPIIENKPLARMIYKKVDIDKEIPADMYQAIAEVLVAVYKIKNRYKKM